MSCFSHKHLSQEYVFPHFFGPPSTSTSSSWGLGTHLFPMCTQQTCHVQLWPVCCWWRCTSLDFPSRVYRPFSVLHSTCIHLLRTGSHSSWMSQFNTCICCGKSIGLQRLMTRWVQVLKVCCRMHAIVTSIVHLLSCVVGDVFRLEYDNSLEALKELLLMCKAF